MFQLICYLCQTEEYQIRDSFVPASTNFQWFSGGSSGFVRLPPKPRRRTAGQHANSIRICTEAGIKKARTRVEHRSNNFRTISEAHPKKVLVFPNSYKEKTGFLADFPHKLYILPKQVAGKALLRFKAIIKNYDEVLQSG